MDATVYDGNEPGGRTASDEEVTAVLGGLTAADGTSYLDIFREARDED